VGQVAVSPHQQWIVAYRPAPGAKDDGVGGNGTASALSMILLVIGRPSLPDASGPVSARCNGEISSGRLFQLDFSAPCFLFQPGNNPAGGRRQGSSDDFRPFGGRAETRHVFN